MNLLTDTWEVAGWVLGVPWVLLSLDLLFRRRKVVTVTEKVEVQRPLTGRETNELLKPYVTQNQDLLDRLKDRETLHKRDLEALSKALAEARELQAALDATKPVTIVRPIPGKLHFTPEQILGTPPTLGKTGKKGIPKKKKAPVKKVEKLVAKQKERK